MNNKELRNRLFRDLMEHAVKPVIDRYYTENPLNESHTSTIHSSKKLEEARIFGEDVIDDEDDLFEDDDVQTKETPQKKDSSVKKQGFEYNEEDTKSSQKLSTMIINAQDKWLEKTDEFGKYTFNAFKKLIDDDPKKAEKYISEMCNETFAELATTEGVKAQTICYFVYVIGNVLRQLEKDGDAEVAKKTSKTFYENIDKFISHCRGSLGKSICELSHMEQDVYFGAVAGLAGLAAVVKNGSESITTKCMVDLFDDLKELSKSKDAKNDNGKLVFINTFHTCLMILKMVSNSGLQPTKNVLFNTMVEFKDRIMKFYDKKLPDSLKKKFAYSIEEINPFKK